MYDSTVCLLFFTYAVVTDSRAPLLSSSSVNSDDNDKVCRQDLESLYHHSHICHAMSTKLEPIVVEMSQSEGGYVSHGVGCVTDSYRTNILWQVRT